MSADRGMDKLQLKTDNERAYISKMNEVQLNVSVSKGLKSANTE